MCKTLRLCLLQGPSAVGKSTALSLLVGEGTGSRLITVTTRPPRPGERDHHDYHFLTPEAFDAAWQSGELCERTSYAGNGLTYGIYRRDVKFMNSRGGLWFCITDANARRQLCAWVPEIVSIALVADKATLRKRMAQRGDAWEAVERRLSRYDDEIAAGQRADAQVDVTHMAPVDVSRLVERLATSLVPKPILPINVVYVSGPYSADPEAGLAAALETGEWLMAQGLTPVIPHLAHHWQRVHPHEYEVWMRYDLALLARCDALIRLPGESPGADREVAWAQEHGMPVFSDKEGLLSALGS